MSILRNYISEKRPNYLQKIKQHPFNIQPVSVQLNFHYRNFGVISHADKFKKTNDAKLSAK